VDRRPAGIAVGIAVTLVIALFALWLASEAYFSGRTESGAPREEVLQPRPILFTDWAADGGRAILAVSGTEDEYLRLIPSRKWAALDLHAEVLERSEEYRWLEMELFASPRHANWKLMALVFYKSRDYRSWEERFEISPVAEYLNDEYLFTMDGEYRILVSPDGWVTIRLPLQTGTRGEIVSLSLTAYEEEVRVRHITLVP